eukprot:TRINITY_DN1964_c1_g1_i1.p1 TRINITY_DN1964_c1_g1~~TRINITY_DN1964_c1_g1_i1.p1  ORF type:complete len:129 (+),score=29.13 TRINITY_DN1964_c1_g1_i1:60-446(+)
MGRTKNEVYGFVGWIMTFVIYIAWFLWAFLPESTLRSYGIEYYPNKWWAISIPLYIMLLYFFACLVYQGVNLFMNHSPDSFTTIYDEYSQEPQIRERSEKEGEDNIPPISDLPIELVNRLLYLDSLEN